MALRQATALETDALTQSCRCPLLATVNIRIHGDKHRAHSGFAPAMGSPGLRTRAQRKTIAMNAITHAQMNSVSLELNSNRSALDKLQALCGEFDTLCKSAQRMSRTDKIFLAALEDE